MTRFTKVLVLAGAAAMVLSPIAAGAAGVSLPVFAQGVSPAVGADGNDESDGKIDTLTVGAILLGLGLGGVLVAGGSGKSGTLTPPDRSDPQSN